MDRDEAIRLLRGSQEGINEFNARRKLGESVPELTHVDLSRCNLVGGDSRVSSGVNFSGMNLGWAKLTGAYLADAKFDDAILNCADLSKTDLTDADFSRAEMGSTNLSEADMFSSTLRQAGLEAANLRKANLSCSDMKGAFLLDVDLSEADLRYCTGMRFDDTFLRHAHFDARAGDPWSLLRRTYTGPALLYNLLFLCAFLGAYSLKAALWLAVNKGQESALALADRIAEDEPRAAEVLRQLEMSLNASGNKLAIWQVLLAVDRGKWLMMLAITLLVYNFVRWVLTREVSRMRDAEERSGYSPKWIDKIWDSPRWMSRILHSERKSRAGIVIRYPLALCEELIEHRLGYCWCWYVHAWIARPLFWVALSAFIWHAWHWLTAEVYLPS